MAAAASSALLSGGSTHKLPDTPSPQEDRAQAILQRWGGLKSDRGNFNNMLQEVSDRVWPGMNFFTKTLVPGSKQSQKVFDSTPTLALNRHAAAMESLLAPRNAQWHTLKPASALLARDHECLVWCQMLTDLMFRVRYNPASNFSSQLHENLRGLAAFGTADLLVDDAASHPSMWHSSTPIVYRAIHLPSFWVDENAVGIPDTLIRQHRMSARNAVAEFGKAVLPDAMVKAADLAQSNSSGAQLYTFVEIVHPASDMGPWAPAGGKAGAKGYWTCTVTENEPRVVREGRIRARNHQVSRYSVVPGEVYGRSPSMDLLPEIKTLNELRKQTLRAGENAIRPPLASSDDALGGAIDLSAGAVNPGWLSSEGQLLIRPILEGGQFAVAKETVEDSRRAVNDGNDLTLFQVLVDNPQMTAYEAALRAQEKGQLIAPTMGRQESELFGPMIERELDILWSSGLIQRDLPPMPEQLRAAGGVLKVVYTSPLSQLAKLDRVTKIQNFVQNIIAIGQLDQNVADVFDADMAAQIIGESLEVPEEVRRPADKIEAIRQAKAQNAQAQQALAAAPVAASAAKDAAQAQAIGASTPVPALPQSA